MKLNKTSQSIPNKTSQEIEEETPIEEEEDEEDDEEEEVEQTQEKPVVKVKPKLDPQEEEKRRIARQVEMEIELLQNTGRYRVELLHRLDEITRALSVVAGVLVELTDNGKENSK